VLATPDWYAEQSLSVFARVTIEGSETVHVVLGEAPENPVRVAGVVSLGGEGVADARVAARALDSPRIRSARTDESGRYELTLDEPGEYSFDLRYESIHRSARESVPDVELHVFDFQLPISAVSGRVLGPDGQPIEGMAVELAATLETAESRSFGVSGWSRTAEDGGFRFEGVAPGTYLLTAGQPWWSSSEEPFGSAQMEVEVVAGEEAGGLELRLDRGGTISGTVRDGAGRPVSGAVIFVRGEGGAVLSRWPAETDGAGQFTTRPLNAGTWTLSARRGVEASPESAPVRLSEGGTARVDLELGPATLLVVRVRDGQGRPVGAGLLVTDTAGREFAGLRSYVDSAVYEKYEEQAIVVGPLPRGAYTVVASNHDGVTAEQGVQLSGEPEVLIEMALSDGQ
jgi:protocatechuate 3,4-dioxygenase beta subunit